jgi:hypothetical protein
LNAYEEIFDRFEAKQAQDAAAPDAVAMTAERVLRDLRPALGCAAMWDQRIVLPLKR